MAKDEKDQEEQEEGSKKNTSTVKIVMIAVVSAVLLSGTIAGAAFYFISDMYADKKTEAGLNDDSETAEEVEEVPAEPPQYYSLDPKFVVSFRDQKSARFMQFSLEIMTRNEDVIKKLDEHTPAIRSSLLMLFDNQKYDVISTREGKKQLLLDITKDVNETLNKVDNSGEGPSIVEAAYFTSFVIQ